MFECNDFLDNLSKKRQKSQTPFPLDYTPSFLFLLHNYCKSYFYIITYKILCMLLDINVLMKQSG